MLCESGGGRLALHIQTVRSISVDVQQHLKKKKAEAVHLSFNTDFFFVVTLALGIIGQDLFRRGT